MNDDELVALLRASGRDTSPSGLAEILADHLDGGLTQSAVVFYFKRAFPGTPLRVLLEAGAWRRLSDGELSTEEFDGMLARWFR
ncbi:hypothetical protein [Kribbella ginsengisoli]|uniref:hypothetical protein n=1 Tax=Kribbella ginsengisoli TaxID=363865 RepID=UPI0031CDE5B5